MSRTKSRADVDSDAVVAGLGDPSPYLLTDERVVVAVRRHVLVLGAAFLETIGFVLAAAMISALVNTVQWVQTICLLICLAALVRLAYLILEWRLERFVITDQRMMLVGGVITRQVAVMPMRKVTDLTFEKPLIGQVFGYGTFIVESAGQDQALSRIDYLPQANRQYLKVSDLLFGRSNKAADPMDDLQLATDVPPNPPSSERIPSPGFADGYTGGERAAMGTDADLQRTDPHLGAKLAAVDFDEPSAQWDEPSAQWLSRFGESTAAVDRQDWVLANADERPAALQLDAITDRAGTSQRMRERLGGLNGRGRRRGSDESAGPIQQRP
ncbi:PH domain-containing protein [Cumulibacter soli]|uniref:PH domain-containing protein n=1 Tax=Cumulibacter soli TaxID=2546344 RepID=UPI001067CDBB|nr:PH domain-containing protein [Cumulibacter soli]